MIVVQPKIYFSFIGLGNFNLIVNFLENPHSKMSLKNLKQ